MRQRLLTTCALFVFVVSLAACSGAFLSTARAVDAQKATIEDAYRQLAIQHKAKQVPEPIFEAATASYDLWAKAQNVAAKVLSSWKAQIDRGEPVNVQAKVDAALKVVLASGQSFLEFIKGAAGAVKKSEAYGIVPSDAIQEMNGPDESDSMRDDRRTALPFMLAGLPFGLVLTTKRRRVRMIQAALQFRDLRHDTMAHFQEIRGGAGPSTEQLLAALAGIGAVLGSLTALLNSNQVQAGLHVVGTLVGKIQGLIDGTGPDFTAMTPEQIEAHFTAKTSDEIRREVGDLPPADA